jgi:predicted XRE-type DNA-binding protein
MTKREIEFENSGGNVFADLGLDEADELYTRAALGAQAVKILQEAGYTQAETSKRLGIKQPEVSALMRARFHRFSQKRLIGFLNKLNLKVTIQISRRQGSEPFQQVSIAP